METKPITLQTRLDKLLIEGKSLEKALKHLAEAGQALESTGVYTEEFEREFFKVIDQVKDKYHGQVSKILHGDLYE